MSENRESIAVNQQDRPASTTRVVKIDAGDPADWKVRRGLGGIPGPVREYPDFPDMTPLWRDARVNLVRSYDWMSRLDTRNNPTSLFPDWDADPEDPASYNFSATDQWVESVHSIGADVLFNFSSSIPSNKLPAIDVEKYGRVVEQIIRHYSAGWANGPAKSIRMYEFGDQPDFGPLHFEGPAVEFFKMYEAFATAAKRVDEGLIVGGDALAFPLNAGADYREGFLTYVRERDVPLDFFSYLCFADATRDPMDFVYVAKEMRNMLDGLGFTEVELMLSYWNYLAIPSLDAPSAEKAAFQAVVSIYLQDTPIDYAIFFRADSGKDPHYGFTDPAGVFDREGAPDERAAALELIGKAISGQRLAASGSDESGFACAASLDGDVARVLVANFVAPDWALEKREANEHRFRVPIGPNRLEIVYQLPPQREGLASAGVESASISLTNLPWKGRTVSISQRSLTGEPTAPVRAQVSDSGSVSLDVAVEPQSVLLIELTAS